MLKTKGDATPREQRIVFRPRSPETVRQFVEDEYAHGVRRFTLICPASTWQSLQLPELGGAQIVHASSASEEKTDPPGMRGIVLLGEDEVWLRRQLRLVARHRSVHVCAPLLPEYARRRPVFVQSIPKSGTHLAFECLKALGYEAPPSLDLPPMDDDFHSGRFYNLQHLRFSDMAGPLQKATPFLTALAGSVVVFIVRDPRDIAVSMAHYVAKQADYHLLASWMKSRTDEEKLTCVLKGQYPMPVYINRYFQFQGTIRDLVLSYANWIQSPLPNVHFVSFEDLIGAEGGGSLERQLQALWELQLALLVEGSPGDFFHLLFSRNALTFRRGKIGSYRDEFTDEHHRYFRSLPQDFMQLTGYSIDREPHECRLPVNPDFQGHVKLPAGEPYIVETRGRHNIVYHNNRFFSVPQELGSLDVRRMSVGQESKVITSPSMTAARHAVDARADRRIIETDYGGFDLIEFGSKVFALSTALRGIELASLSAEAVCAWISKGRCVEADSLQELKQALADRTEVGGERDGFTLYTCRGQFCALSKVLGDVDLSRQTETQLRQLESDAFLIRGKTLDEVCSRVNPPPAAGNSSPIIEELTNLDSELVSHGRCGEFEIVNARGWFHAFAVNVSAPELKFCGRETFVQWRESFRWSFHPREAALREWCVDTAVQREQDFPGFRVIRFRGHHIALSDVLGEVDVARTPDFLFQRWKKDNQCFVARSRDELWKAVLAAVPPKAEGQLYDWNLWRFLNRPMALKDGVPLPKDEAALDGLRQNEQCLVARNPEVLRDAIFARVPPRLIDSSFQGFNLVEYRLEFFALSEALGPLDVSQISEQQAAQWQSLGQFFRAPSIEELWLEVLLYGPRLLKELPGFNVVTCHGRIVAVSQALGPMNLQHVDPQLRAEWGARGQWIEAACPDDLEPTVDALHRRWLATNRYGWDFFAYRGRIWAVPHGELGGPVESVTDGRLNVLTRQGQCLWAASEPELELMCLQRRTEDLARRLHEMQVAHQQLQQRWVLRVGRGAKRLARIPRRLAAAGWRRVARRLFSL